MNLMNPETKPEILLVDDNPADLDLTIEASRADLVATASQRRIGRYGSHRISPPAGEICLRGRPDLVLLDLNLPGKDGRSVLAEVKSDPGAHAASNCDLQHIASPARHQAHYELGANSYVSKPRNLQDWMTAVNSTERFLVWLRCLAREENQ